MFGLSRSYKDRLSSYGQVAIGHRFYISEAYVRTLRSFPLFHPFQQLSLKQLADFLRKSARKPHYVALNLVGQHGKMSIGNHGRH
ncbi:hypothetical protein [Paraburkholderia hospita]|uniref:hypothetical protein n=1 Tax=Paraburkholderia hospita TaxID=169430 RepID=UPI001056E1CD|nr:hypothetical protein [Paraburkholderia hospita]